MLTIVRVVAFHEAPSVDVDDLTFLAAFAPQHVKSAYHLTKPVADTSGPSGLLVA